MKIVNIILFTCLWVVVSCSARLDGVGNAIGRGMAEGIGKAVDGTIKSVQLLSEGMASTRVRCEEENCPSVLGILTTVEDEESFCPAHLLLANTIFAATSCVQSLDLEATLVFRFLTDKGTFQYRVKTPKIPAGDPSLLALELEKAVPEAHQQVNSDYLSQTENSQEAFSLWEVVSLENHYQLIRSATCFQSEEKEFSDHYSFHCFEIANGANRSLKFLFNDQHQLVGIGTQWSDYDAEKNQGTLSIHSP